MTVTVFIAFLNSAAITPDAARDGEMQPLEESIEIDRGDRRGGGGLGARHTKRSGVAVGTSRSVGAR